MDRAVAVMLQREIPPDINARVAAMADTAEVPVVLDVGGTDEPVDPAILPHVSLIAPNESELAFISGVPAQAISDGGHIPVAASIPGGVSLSGLRAGVAALKAKFSAAGNHRVEVLVTLGRLGSVHFGAEWTPASSHLDHAEGGDGGAAASGGAEHGGATASGGAGNEPATGIDGMLPHETRMGVFDIKGGTPLDTTGAGDCYRGSYVAARCAGLRIGLCSKGRESGEWLVVAQSRGIRR
jgi:sugar/nucleoside kinase (ribokinase family)